MGYATPADVIRRLDDEPDTKQLALIEESIEDATDRARDLGAPWDDITVPDAVRRVVAAAVARYVRNPDGFDQSRAADEAVGWSEGTQKNFIEFTPQEEARIKRFASPVVSGFGTGQNVAWGQTEWDEEVVYVPWDNDTYKPMPLIAINDIHGIYRGRWG